MAPEVKSLLDPEETVSVSQTTCPKVGTAEHFLLLVSVLMHRVGFLLCILPSQLALSSCAYYTKGCR